jgi:hypothetical protein
MALFPGRAMKPGSRDGVSAVAARSRFSLVNRSFLTELPYHGFGKRLRPKKSQRVISHYEHLIAKQTLEHTIWAMNNQDCPLTMVSARDNSVLHLPSWKRRLESLHPVSTARG